MEFYRENPKVGVVCNYGYADHFKSSFLSVDLAMPLTAENATGMSLLCGVISRGSKAFPSMDRISRYLAKYYGASLSIRASKSGEMEFLSFSVSYLDNCYAIDGEDICGAMADLLQNLIFEPLLENGAFSADYVAQEKQNLSDRILGIFNDKRLYSLERCKELMFSDEAYSVGEMGDRETLQSFDAKNLFDFYQKVLNDSYVVVTYVGKKGNDSAKDLADRFAAREDAMPITLICNKVDAVREVVEPMELNQSKLNLGFRLGATAQANPVACRLFNVLYGGSATSKLFMNVRERLSLCYYCSSQVDRFKNVMLVSSGIEAAKYEEARKEIEAQLAAVASGDFSDAELEDAKMYLIDTFYGMIDSKSMLASQMISGVFRDEMKTPEQEAEEVRAVSKELIMQIAKETALDTVYFLKGVQSGE